MEKRKEEWDAEKNRRPVEPATNNTPRITTSC
jgi:hypothetical protein